MDNNIEQGALTEAVFFILISMIEPRHGYAVMLNVEMLTNGRVRLGAGTLYGAINTLLQKQWIYFAGDNNDSRRKEYAITDLGLSVLKNEIFRLEELLSIGKKEIGG